MNFYCDVINQRFAGGYRSVAEPRIVLTQNNDIAGKFYLLQPNQRNGRYPFMYDPSSGSSGVVAKAVLCNPGGTPLTLTAPATLTPITNGFSGLIQTNTSEIETFLTGYAERQAVLAIEVTDSGDASHITSFQREVTLRMDSTAAETSSIPGVIRLRGVTGYVGGGTTNLDGAVTAGNPIGTRYEVTINGYESHWELAAGSQPSDPDSGIILTTDGGQLLRTIGL